MPDENEARERAQQAYEDSLFALRQRQNGWMKRRAAMLRKGVVLAGFIAVFAMGAYPPWNQTYTRGNFSQHESAYGWLFKPPYPDVAAHDYWKIEVDIQRLALQWILISIAVGGLLWILPAAPSGPRREANPETVAWLRKRTRERR